MCPDNAEEYLNRYYGPDWKTVAKTQDFDHIKGISIKSLEFDIKTL